MKKYLWVDITKGLGILSVVAGHIYGGEIARIIYLFHMPLFFFISGYLFKPTTEYSNFFIKKISHLLIPYYSFLILLDTKTILGFFYDTFNNSMTADKYLFYREHFLSIIYGGQNLTGYFGVFWFVTCLFLTQQVYNYLYNKLKSNSLAAVVSLMLIISYLEHYLFSNLSLPWNVNVVLGALPIFYLGNISKKRKNKPNKTLVHFLGLIVVLFSFWYLENVYNMKSAYYGIPIITLTSSLIIILNIKEISIYLSKNRLSSKVLSELGRASMVIMFLHQYLQIKTSIYLTENYNFRFAVSTVASYLIYLFLSKNKFSRILFLGSYVDFKEYFICKSSTKANRASHSDQDCSE